MSNSVNASASSKTVALAGMLLMAVALVGCDQSSGSGQKTTGHVESAVGSLTGDTHLKNQGKKDEVVGGVKGAVHDVNGAIKDATK